MRGFTVREAESVRAFEVYEDMIFTVFEDHYADEVDGFYGGRSGGVYIEPMFTLKEDHRDDCGVCRSSALSTHPLNLGYAVTWTDEGHGLTTAEERCDEDDEDDQLFVLYEGETPLYL